MSWPQGHPEDISPSPGQRGMLCFTSTPGTQVPRSTLYTEAGSQVVLPVRLQVSPDDVSAGSKLKDAKWSLCPFCSALRTACRSFFLHPFFLCLPSDLLPAVFSSPPVSLSSPWEWGNWFPKKLDSCGFVPTILSSEVPLSLSLSCGAGWGGLEVGERAEERINIPAVLWTECACPPQSIQ